MHILNASCAEAGRNQRVLVGLLPVKADSALFGVALVLHGGAEGGLEDDLG